MASEQEKRKIQEEISRQLFYRQESRMIHNSYSRERRELECIRTGDLEGIKKVIREPLEGELGTLSKNPLRSEKNVGMCAMAIYARAAISAGILSDEAFTAGDIWCLKIDEAQSIEQVRELVRDMAVYFTNMVREHDASMGNSNHDVSQTVETCKKYIFQHLHEKLSVQSIASALYLNADYLSNAFSTHVGKTISAYIRKQKIHEAKHLLIYSPYSCNSISSSLGFTHQSHFGKVFRAETGMSPNEFRREYGTIKYIEDKN